MSDFEKETGCKVNMQGRQHLRRDGDADAHRQLRRRVGVGRRDAAPDRRRRRRAGQHRPDPELRGRLRRPEGQAAQLGRRPDVRRAARPRREPAHVEQGRGQAGARQLERRLGPELAAQGQGHRVRQPDLHRRRGAVPEGDEAGARIDEPVRARRQAVQGGDRPAQAAARRSSASTGRTTRRSRRPSTTATRVVGTTWQVIANLLEADGKVEGRDDAAQGGLDRLVGHLDGRTRRPRTRTACTCG